MSTKKIGVKKSTSGIGRRSKNKGKYSEQDDSDKESLAFKILSAEQTQELMDIQNVDDLQTKMSELMKLSDYLIDLKEASMLDCYVGTFWWAKEQNFTQQQVSGFFTAIHTLLENVKEKHLSLVENIIEWKKMLVGIGNENAETSGGLEFFDINQTKILTDYIHQSIFQHYKMYEYMFTVTQAEEIIGTDLEVEIAKPADMPWPPPLDEGITEEVFTNFVATPPPTPADQKKLATPQQGTPARGKDDAVPNGDQDGSDGDKADSQKEADLLTNVTPEEIQKIMDSVAKEMLGGLQSDIAMKLRERENSIINRINKIHISS